MGDVSNCTGPREAWRFGGSKELLEASTLCLAKSALSVHPEVGLPDSCEEKEAMSSWDTALDTGSCKALALESLQQEWEAGFPQGPYFPTGRYS